MKQKLWKLVEARDIPCHMTSNINTWHQISTHDIRAWTFSRGPRWRSTIVCQHVHIKCQHVISHVTSRHNMTATVCTWQQMSAHDSEYPIIRTYVSGHDLTSTANYCQQTPDIDLNVESANCFPNIGMFVFNKQVVFVRSIFSVFVFVHLYRVWSYKTDLIEDKMNSVWSCMSFVLSLLPELFVCMSFFCVYAVYNGFKYKKLNFKISELDCDKTLSKCLL